MKETILKVAAAGLLHDIGKFAGREVLEVSETYFNNNAGIYLPFKNGRYTHDHALYTAAFIEQLSDILPAAFNAHQWGEGDSLINLAAGHHNPSTPMQWILAVADRVSSGWDRDPTEDEEERASGGRNYLSIRMVPLFEQLRYSTGGGFESVGDFEYAYSMAPLGPTSIFPLKTMEAWPSDRERAKEEYRRLFQAFADNLARLAHRDRMPLWLEHFESLLMRYTAMIPSDRSGGVIPDVSLYDHAKATAAIATALYQYHEECGSLSEEAVRDYDEKKLLIISGDFRGIQDFIFEGHGALARYRSKILRGRSLAVSLLTELASDLLCRKLGLPPASVILNAAGKFTILAHNTAKAKEAMEAARHEINDWMFKVSMGRTMMAFSSVQASCSDFIKGGFHDLWLQISRRMAENKFQGLDLSRYGGAVEWYLDSFEEDPPLCSLCGRRPARGTVNSSAYLKKLEGGCCNVCRDHVFLGTNAVRRPRIFILEADSGAAAGFDDMLLEPLFGRYQICFSDNVPSHAHAEEERNRLLRVWSISAHPDDLPAGDVTAKPLAGYVPRYGPHDNEDQRIRHGERQERKTLDLVDMIEEGDPKSLHHIAAMALNPQGKDEDRFSGIAALGVLKADIDELGLLMACGLKKERFTISRLATLSRQLDSFFSLFLPYKFSSETPFENTYTVFAGGDDLFLIGPWNRIVDLAMDVSEDFTSYVCLNEEITISAGIALHKPQTPVPAMARSADEALKHSKGLGRNRLTLFGETAEWKEARELEEVRDTLESWLDQGWLSRVMLYRLNDYIRMAADEAKINELKTVPLPFMECTKWRSFLSYAVERNVASALKGEERKRTVREAREQLAIWLDKYRSKLRWAAWSILYNRR